MAGYDNGTSFWEHMNIYAWIGALLDGYVLVDVLLRIYQDYCNGKKPDLWVCIAIVTTVILAVCIFFICFSVSHMKKYPHTTWVTFPDFFRTFLPFLEKKEYRDSYCDDQVLRGSKLWKRFGVRIKWGSFVWGALWSWLVIYMCLDVWRYYNNPYEPDHYVNRRVRVFYDTEYVLSACYLRLFIAAIFLILAIIVFSNVKDCLTHYSFECWLRELNITCEELNQEFVDATNYGNRVWCGKHFLFVRSESDGEVIPYDKIHSMEIMRTYTEVVLFIKVTQWSLMITDDKGEEFVTSAFWSKPYYDVISMWESMLQEQKAD